MTRVVELAIAVWNSVCGAKLSPIKKITPSRRNAFMRHWKEDFDQDAEAWERFCQRVAASPFLTNANGKNRADWKANFDFVLEPRNFVRIEEGLWDPVAKRDPWAWVDALQVPVEAAESGPETNFDLAMTRDENGTFRPK